VSVGVAAVKTAYDMYGDDFKWKDTAYEYVFNRNPFDVIAGTDKLRASIERGDSLGAITESWKDGLDQFKSAREEFLLY
jgi:uncharacterized protein YbbC (DUF1343 family)